MSNLANFRTAMANAITTPAAPDDGSGAEFELIDTLVDERGRGQHRQILWRLPRIAGIQAQPGDSIRLTWIQPLELFIHRRDQTYLEFVDDVCDDLIAVLLRYATLTAQGSGVFNAVLEDPTFEIDEVEPERPARAGGVPMFEVARVVFPFVVTTGES